MGNKPNLDDYVDVRERMSGFFEKYPGGSFQSECSFTQVDGRWVAVVKASAFRNEEDKRPGQGLAFEFIPGKTPYTKDSELMNCETSAWGRAVMAVGAADSKKPIASREEVRNRTAEPDNVVDNLEGRQALRELCEKRGWEPEAIAKVFQTRMSKAPRTATNDELSSFVNLVKEGVIPIEPGPA